MATLAPVRLTHFLESRWQTGDGPSEGLVDPSTEAPIAEVSGGGLDLAAALQHGRSVGGPALRAMTFAQRGAMLRALSEAVVGCRQELLDLSMANNGATRSDAKFDVDGASFTLAAYAELGESLGDRRYLVDGEALELVRSKRFAGLHLQVPRPGVAVHLNAFNFPAWGLAEKAATALLAGMPILSKPGPQTALVAWKLAEAMVASGALPDGAFAFLAGPPGDLLAHLDTGDVLAFTGSSATGQHLRTHAGLAARGVPVGIEADSLNAAVAGPDLEPGSDAWDLLVADVARDVTQKTGQKCTAIRRVLVPEGVADDLVEALADELGRRAIGDPRADGVRMGPVVSAAQRAHVLQGLARLDAAATRVAGSGGRPEAIVAVGDAADVGYFVDAHLYRTSDAEASLAADAVHDHEVFGPSATVLPYDGTVAQGARLVARGRGSLVTTLYSNDRRWTTSMALEAAGWAGRVCLASDKVAGTWPGPGTVLPQTLHGGPGRAGGGEELGGLRGMAFYMQRTALQGYRPLLEKVFDGT